MYYMMVVIGYLYLSIHLLVVMQAITSVL